MPRICYVSKRFGADTMAIIDRANAICAEYAAQGFTLTLRQLYYQFVARGYIPNKDTEYKRLGGIVSDARLAGLLDWNYLEDRTRNVKENSSWDSPASIIESAARSYHEDLWDEQENRVEVWIEKDALVGVIETTCRDLDVPFFSCRGYTSQSEMWAAAMRLRRHAQRGQQPVILHLGDHDPSGIDMSRDIEERLNMFLRGHGEEPIIFERIALTMDQVQQFNPPPNPAKSTDARFANYLIEHGDESWELDALDPTTLDGLIRDAVANHRDDGTFEEKRSLQEKHRGILNAIKENWDDTQEWVIGEFGSVEDDS